MCGIAGIVSLRGKSVDPGQVISMLSIIKHRGPDDEGLMIGDNYCLGHVRLSIIDLSPSGHQPMYSRDRRYCIVFNGEIYNYPELKKTLAPYYTFSSQSDTEVLLAAYIVWGEDCLLRLNGDFAFVIADTLEKTLFGARDRFGIKPFYYYQDDNQFIFASEIKAIHPFLSDPSPNSNSIFEYLVFNRTDQSEETFFDQLLKLKHGHCFSIHKNKVVIRRWYNLSDHLTYPTKVSPDEYRQELRKSVALRLRSDVPVGISLSGGIDSSALTSILCHDLEQKKLSSFSAVFEKGSSLDESPFINEFQGMINQMHVIQPSASSFFSEMDDFMISQSEPVPGISPYAQYKVMQLAKGKVSVTLDGQGADEMLGGYTYFHGSYFKELLMRLHLLRLAKESFEYIRIHSSLDSLSYFAYYLMPVKWKNHVRWKTYGSLSPDFFQQNHSYSTIGENLYHPKSLHDFFLKHFEYKLEHLLKWDDLNSMHFSIESRIPFLDHHLVEKTLSLPPDQIIRNGVSKYILRESVKDILPKRIYHRHDKKGFGIPAACWFRNPAFQTYIFDLLRSSRFKSRGYLDADKCLEKYRLHVRGSHDYSGEIWKWINLETWFNRFIDNRHGCKLKKCAPLPLEVYSS
jgi:asparagine synthase (glutamine-hydrolysing)